MKTIRKYYGWFAILALVSFAGVQAAFAERPAHSALPADEETIEDPYQPYVDEEEVKKPAPPPVNAQRVIFI